MRSTTIAIALALAASSAIRSSIAKLDEGEFTEGHELPGKWKVAKQMVGPRLSQEEAKRLLARLG